METAGRREAVLALEQEELGVLRGETPGLGG
jgi:hypothetical protein